MDHPSLKPYIVKCLAPGHKPHPLRVKALGTWDAIARVQTVVTRPDVLFIALNA